MGKSEKNIILFPELMSFSTEIKDLYKERNFFQLFLSKMYNIENRNNLVHCSQTQKLLSSRFGSGDFTFEVMFSFYIHP